MAQCRKTFTRVDYGRTKVSQAGCTVAEHLTTDPEVKGSYPAFVQHLVKIPEKISMKYFVYTACGECTQLHGNMQ